MLLQDLAFPDSGRTLQGPCDRSTSSDHDSGIVPFKHLGIYIVGVGLVLVLSVCWCIRLLRSESTRDVNAAAAPVPAQDERAEGGDGETESTLAQRRLHAILELFRTSQVTMVRNEM
jgi:hypothetical protein